MGFALEFFSYFSLWVCWDARDFSVLILSPATLPDLLVSSSSFRGHLRVSVFSAMSSANKDSFTSSPIWIPLFLFLLCLW